MGFVHLCNLLDLTDILNVEEKRYKESQCTATGMLAWREKNEVKKRAPRK